MTWTDRVRTVFQSGRWPESHVAGIGDPQLTGAGNEAHVPAQQPPSGKDARFPAAHAYPRRSSRDHEPPRQGSLAPVGLTMLPAANRLRRRRDLADTMRRGRRSARPTLVVHALATGTAQTLVGFAVGRKVGNSVVRSRVTRRLRHVVRPLLADLAPGYQLVVRARPPAALAGSGELASDLRAALADVPAIWRSG